MKALNVLVLFGGMAEEHDISVKSAKQLTKWMNPQKYNAHFVHITRDGCWQYVLSPNDLDSGTPVTLSVNRSVKGAICIDDRTISPVDVVFPMLHGHYGEDGAIQGVLELFGIPYVGCDVTASAICMDKSLAYLVAMQAGVPTPKFRVLERGSSEDIGDFAYPIFVKPARSGSSFGITKVHCKAELREAINDAQKYDNKVLIEEAIVGQEVGCAVLGNGSDIITGEIDQIVLSGGFFRIHQEKRPEKGSENAVIHVPAKIPNDLRCRVAETAKKLYRTIGCRGLARVDMFLLADGTVMLNEINTMPGFTSYSRYPRMMEVAGIPMTEVVDKLIAEAR